MHLKLQNSTGAVKEVKRGFSWTVFFFGGFVPLFRGDIKWFFLMWILSVITLGLAHFYFMFKYNEIYVKGLLADGFYAADESGKVYLQSKGLTV